LLDDGHATLGFVRLSSPENDCVPDTVDPDLDPLGLNDEQVRMDPRDDAAAGVAATLGILPGAEEDGRQAAGFALETLFG
jgi:hypothetical protein